MTNEELVAAANTFRAESAYFDGDINPGSIIGMWLATADALEAFLPTDETETNEGEEDEPFWTCPDCGKESEDGLPESHMCWGNAQTTATDIESLSADLLDGLRNRLNAASTAERSAFAMSKIRRIREANVSPVTREAQEPTCTCTVTDPKYWTTYGSAVEPGSMLEPDYDCPVHFPANSEAQEPTKETPRFEHRSLRRCEADWIDGGCTMTGPPTAEGWFERVGRNGDTFWLCPEHGGADA